MINVEAHAEHCQMANKIILMLVVVVLDFQLVFICFLLL